jgi:GMP synthase (glutamine-hydrolysing)
MKLHYLQHVPFENSGNIEKWAKEKEFPVSFTKLYAGESLPQQQSFDFLVIMGGPMNIYEEDKFSWLAEEKEFIKQAVNNGKTVIGVCLGAQLIADALGAKVYKNHEKEIGWFPIKLSPQAKSSKSFQDFPEEFTAFHWHGDTFEIPNGAIPLGSSAACQNQGFIYQDKVIGLQFHLETSYESLKSLADNCKDELVEGNFIQKEDFMLSQDKYFAEIENYLYKLLNNLNHVKDYK